VANTTNEYWSYAGVSLQTFAYNIQTIGGDRIGVPTIRGTDITIPFRDGDTFMPKAAGPRVISLGMWVQGSDTDGNTTARGTEEEFDRNWARLRKLFWGSPRKQFPLSKTVSYWKADGTRVPVRVTAQASFSGGLSPTMTGRNRGRFTVDLLLTDPWFYPDVPLTKSVPVGSSWTIPAEQMGDDPTDNIRIFFRGTSVSSPNVQLVANSEFPQSLTMSLLANLGGVSMGTQAEVYVKSGYVYDRTNTRYLPSIVYHTGAKAWMMLGTMDDQVLRVSSSGSGNNYVADFTVWPRYF
jgi:hypothetical protein